MHGRIFQVSSSPIRKDDYLSEDDVFDEHLMDYSCDSIDPFKEDLKWFMECIPEGVFTWNGKSRYIVFSGNIQPILDKWQQAVDDAYENLRGNIGDSQARWLLKDRLQNPLGDFLFVIEGWSGLSTVSFNSFVGWLSSMTLGQKIHFGAIFDYHF